MKSMGRPSATIFFMTHFYRAGGMAPLPPPPRSATGEMRNTLVAHQRIRGLIFSIVMKTVSNRCLFFPEDVGSKIIKKYYKC